MLYKIAFFSKNLKQMQWSSTTESRNRLGIFSSITSWLFVKYSMAFFTCEDYVNNIHLNLLHKAPGLLNNDFLIPRGSYSHCVVLHLFSQIN